MPNEPLKKKILTYGVFLLLASLVALSFLVFLPRTYDVPSFQSRVGTQFWTLSMGDRIGYFLISQSTSPKPTPIIYLHGGPGGRVTDNTIQALAPLTEDGYDLYFYDQIGSGHSDRLAKIDGYTVARHLKDLGEIIAKIGKEKVILIGHSWGAILAALYLADHPEKVEKVIFSGPGPILPIRKELAHIEPPDSLQLEKPHFSNQQGNAAAQNLRSQVMRKWAYIAGKKLASDEEADAYCTYLFSELNKSAVSDTSRQQTATGGAGYYAHIMTAKSFSQVRDRRSQLQNSPVPMLLLRGQVDNQKWGFAQEYLTLFPHHTLTIIPNSGHFIDVEQPVLYLKAIRAFLLENNV